MIVVKMTIVIVNVKTIIVLIVMTIDVIIKNQYYYKQPT